MKEMPIDMISGIPMIYVHFWSRLKNKYRSIFLTLDTGATITTISKDALRALGYVGCGKNKKRITTASGIEYVDEVVLDKVMFGGFELLDVPVYAHTFPQESFSSGGVIGMNVLSNFDVFISFQRRILQLTKVCD